MTKTHDPLRFAPLGILRGFTGFLARIGIGLVLILVAGFVALFTAFLGLMLALAALVFRSSARRSAPVTTPDTGETLTLEARRTPRGWTVE
jgi:hypothetical protein